MTTELALDRLAVHTITHKPWSLQQMIDAYTSRGVQGITVWRNVIDPAQGGVSPQQARTMLDDAGMTVVGLARGGGHVSSDPAARSAAHDENLRALDEAAAMGAPVMVLVVGSAMDVDLFTGRQQVAEAIAKLLPEAKMRGVALAIEPLHPMYAAARSCINRMAEARAIWEQLDDPACGVAVDVYHTFWDPDLEQEIQLAGAADKLLAFHVCDWREPTRDMLNDRGLMGQGCIDIRLIRSWMERAGFGGYCEVEIFSTELWAGDQDAYADQIIAASKACV